MNLESIPLQAFLIVSSALFCIGIWGLLNSRNAVRVLMSIELMLNAVNINLMAFSSYVDNNLIQGQVFTIFVITVAAAEAAVGLAILLSLYRNRVTVDMESFNLLKSLKTKNIQLTFVTDYIVMFVLTQQVLTKRL